MRWLSRLPFMALLLWGCSSPDGAELERRFDLVELAGTAALSAVDSEPLRAEDGRILLPVGARLDYHFRLPRGCRLAMERVTGRNGSDGELVVAFVRAGSRERELARFEVGTREVDLALPAGDEEIARLRFEARSDTVVLIGPGVDCPPASEAPQPAAAPTAASPPNVIVYLIDTLRKDHLGLYGYGSPTSPNLDAFAEEAWVFDDALGQAAWTRTAVASIMTGLYPHEHGVEDRGDALAENLPTLAEELEKRGYTTAALLANGNIDREFGFARGFDHYLRALTMPTSRDLEESAAALLADGELPEPFFLYVHSNDPHAPYDPAERWKEAFASDVSVEERGTIEVLKEFRDQRRQIFPEMIEEIVALYDAEIAFTDAYFGRLLELFEGKGLLDDTLVVVLADHGEEFWDHGDWGHGHQLYDELVQIPLIIKLPGQRSGGRISELARQIDVLPTVLEAAGISVGGLTGRSLMPLLRGESSVGAPEGYARIGLDRREGAALVEGRWKLIVPRSPHLGKEPQLFDRYEDPSESTDVAAQHPVIVGYLLSRVRQIEARAGDRGAAPEVVPSPEVERELRALGYLD